MGCWKLFVTYGNSIFYLHILMHAKQCLGEIIPNTQTCMKYTKTISKNTTNTANSPSHPTKMFGNITIVEESKVIQLTVTYVETQNSLPFSPQPTADSPTLIFY